MHVTAAGGFVLRSQPEERWRSEPTHCPAPCLSCRERAAQCRGLCLGCYRCLSSAVGLGETTWEALEADWWALPANRQGRRFRPREGP